MHTVLLLLTKVYHPHDVQPCSYRESDTQIALVLAHFGSMRNKNMMISSVATSSSRYKVLHVLEFWCQTSPSLGAGDEGMI